jgi:hypothetical protein
MWLMGTSAARGPRSPQHLASCVCAPNHAPPLLVCVTSHLLNSFDERYLNNMTMA